METRRVERAGKGVLGLRYVGKIWVCPEKDTGFKQGERPYVIEGFAGRTVIVRRVNGRLREEWQKLQVKEGHPRFSVQWSDEDKQYVGTCSKFPSMSFLDDQPDKALLGIIRLVKEATS